MLTIGLEGFQPADSTVKREMQMRICMNHALAKVIYIIGGRGGMVVVVAGLVDSPSNTDTKQHSLHLIINTIQGTHTLHGMHIIHPLNNDF